jgi:carbon-monoxide dehydrogenase large subunit
MTLGHLEIPSTITSGGFKGVGESGVAAPPPAIANAVCGAVRPLGVQIYETPITPARLWAATQAAGGSQAWPWSDPDTRAGHGERPGL